VHPEATELCTDGIDNDCDGEIDEADGEPVPWYRDDDGDGWGQDGDSTLTCTALAGYAPVPGDCDDDDPTRHPEADELCNGIDEDCDGAIDNDAIDAPVWFADADSDGYGDPDAPVADCDQPPDTSANDLDCDDTRPDVNPDGTEICFDGIDNDCDADPNDCAMPSELPLGDANVRLLGETAGDEAGTALAGGDFDGDGVGDVAVGGPFGGDGLEGLTYVIGGEVSGSTLSVAIAQALGEVGGDRAGIALASPGDVDGDGTSELIVGAPGSDQSGTNAGAAYLIFGPLSGAIALGDSALVLHGASSSHEAGTAVAGGDVDGDGVGDVVVGAPRHTLGGPGAGAAHLVLGGATGTLTLDDADSTLTSGQAGFGAGAALAVVDLDGDGTEELAVGAPSANGNGGIVFVGSYASGDGRLTDMTQLTGSGGDTAGTALANCGDVDGDGRSELCVGSPGEDTGGSAAGAVFLVSGMPADATLATAATATLVGESFSDFAGWSVSTADIDADGLLDVIVGAYGHETGGSQAGAAYVVRGPLSGVIDLGDADVRMVGEAANDRAGWAVLGAHVTADDIGDVVVGAPTSSSASTDAGAVYFVFGRGI
jgi:hypothetical protein